MVGNVPVAGERERSTAKAQAASAAAGPAASCFDMRGVGRRGAVQPIDLTLEPGRIVGLAGLLGSGRTETARLLFGADRADTGTITADGKPIKLGSPRHAVRHGIAYCPEDRKKEGIVGALSVRENIVLALQARRGWWRPLGRARERRIAEHYVKALGIRARDIEQPIELLSGGNQQKALLARWLAIDPKMLILDEPTRGIDVAAKFEIMEYVSKLCEKGLGILLISSEIPEVLRISDRIAVLRDRRKVAELAGDALDEQAVYRLIAGGGA
jgi:simple sugar transport system ATP-binding protein